MRQGDENWCKMNAGVLSTVKSQVYGERGGKRDRYIKGNDEWLKYILNLTEFFKKFSIQCKSRGMEIFCQENICKIGLNYKRPM
jgi:hypothetical protein